MKIREMKGLGPKSGKQLFDIGITEANQLLEADPYVVYERLRKANPTISLNFIYALIGAIENKSWQEIKRERKTEILMRLDDMGIAPE